VTTDNSALASLENAPPADNNTIAPQANADWQDALDAYYAEVGDR
jgi:hypothetical protein